MLCFYICVPFCSRGGGRIPSMHHRSHDQGGVHPEDWADSPPLDTTGYGQQAGGTYPTVMHTYYRPQRSCKDYVFTPVCLSTGSLPQCMMGYHSPTPGADTPPPSRRLRLRTVHILLECILVLVNFS